MTDLFELPSRQFHKRLLKTWDESKHPRGRGGRWVRGGGAVGLLAGVTAALVRTNRRLGTRGDFIARRAAGNLAQGRALGLKVGESAGRKPGGVLDRDAVRHMRALEGLPFRERMRFADKQLVDELTRRHLMRSQGLMVRPLKVPK
jgi:hypothetical protein